MPVPSRPGVALYDPTVLDTRSFLADVQDWAERVHERAVEEHAAELDRVAPERTGEMRRGQEIRHLAPLRSEITYPAEYASFTDEGTEPHFIPANPALSFEVDGMRVIIVNNPGRYGQAFEVDGGAALVVFKAGVNHPGTRGTRWWSDLMTDEQWATSLEAAARDVRF